MRLTLVVGGVLLLSACGSAHPKRTPLSPAPEEKESPVATPAPAPVTLHRLDSDTVEAHLGLPATAAAGEQEALSAATFHQKRQRAPRLDWTGLLKRTFKVDVFCCPKSACRRRMLACLTQGAVLRCILCHLRLPEPPPPLPPARGAPRQALWD